ncbi:MAG: Gldg family protein, partial [Anaerolineales bacterium]
MKQLISITRKELSGYFGSPMALIFIGAFLAVTLFSFFWVDTFFARGIADVRPLFRWMPLLMIFLVSALTMRQWSEEQRSGTLEILLTLPVSHVKLVLGKFLAVVVLVVVALALTLFLPITVSILGNLDWGPVVGGYLAAILLAASYAAIGLFVSSRTDNQIVALITSVLLCALFYFVGSAGVTEFLPDSVAEILKAVGTGSRFESIERGVVDLRDLVYYVSLTLMFLTLNVASLDIKRWSTGLQTRGHRRTVRLTTSLILLNAIVLNVWLFPLRGFRLDLTQQNEYTLSQATRDLLSTLQEPLLVRGYFSAKTHPLLAPLVPRIRDMLREYEIAGRGNVQLEIIDPAEEPELEAEANQVYGIRPTPFQVAGRYETSVINSYFNILISYGDQSTVLDYGDLIEVQSMQDGTLDVGLRNLEYDLTRSMKKVVYGFQSLDAVLASLSEPVHLDVYLTPDTLPEELAEAPQIIENVAGDIAAQSNGKFTYQIIDPYDAASPISQIQLYEQYGMQPISVSLFSEESFYFHMVLTHGDQAAVSYPSWELSEAEFRLSLESALKRMSPGFLKVVGLWLPAQVPTQDMFGQMQQPLQSWQAVMEQLERDYEVRTVDLSSGQVPADVDVLVLIAPQGFSELELFAVDQYLMRGGAVVASAGKYAAAVEPYAGGLMLQPLEGTIEELLASYGVVIEDSLVMDPQNEPFPVPVVREVAGFQVREYQLIDYPFFVDVRPDAMDAESPIVANLPAVTLNWVSPITVDEALNAEREVSALLQSSAESWLKTSLVIQPNFTLYPELGFERGEEVEAYTLAVSVRGVFESYFAESGAPTPDTLEGQAGQIEPEDELPASVIEISPESARLVVFGSAEFLDDLVFEISSALGNERYLNSLQLLQNAVDWGVEDLELLGIRARGTHARVLDPLGEREQSYWEAANYAVALLALMGISVLWNTRQRQEQPMELVIG